RLNSNGTLDTTFNSTGPVPGEVVQDLGIHSAVPPGVGQSIGRALAVQPDGTILVAGQVLDPTPRAPYDGFVARFLSNGSLDTSFHNGGEVVLFNTHADDSASVGPLGVAYTLGGFDGSITNIIPQADGKILVYIDDIDHWIRLNPDAT